MCSLLPVGAFLYKWSLSKYVCPDFCVQLSQRHRLACEYAYPRIVYIGSSSFQLRRLLHSQGEGTDRRPLQKNRSLFQSLCWTKKLKLAKTSLQLSYADTSHPCDQLSPYTSVAAWYIRPPAMNCRLAVHVSQPYTCISICVHNACS